METSLDKTSYYGITSRLSTELRDATLCPHGKICLSDQSDRLEVVHDVREFGHLLFEIGWGRGFGLLMEKHMDRHNTTGQTGRNFIDFPSIFALPPCKSY